MLSKLRTPLVLVLGMTLGVGATLGVSAWAARARTGLPWQQINLFAQVYEYIRNDYVEAIPADKLMDSALHGMAADLDPYSAYLNPKEYEEMRIDTAGAYSGVGIEITTEGGALRVLAPLPDSPAERAGIWPGDEIVAIDDVPVDANHLDVAVDSMRGKPGEPVTLTVRRAGVPKPLMFSLVRRKVQVHSVSAQMAAPDLAYLRISQFSETTAADVAVALEHLQHAGSIHGLVIDLRNNPGGVLEAAVEIADDFLDSGSIVTAQGRAADAAFAMDATPGDMLKGAPIVILVNGGSASASEILAGALKDHKRALLMGQKTYGKGVVQSVLPLEQGGALKLTTARYLTPSGISIDKRGIEPDIVLDLRDDRASLASPAGEVLLGSDAEVQAALGELKTLIKKSG